MTRKRTKRKTENRNRPADDPFSVLLEMNFNIAVINMFKIIAVEVETFTRYLAFILKKKLKNPSVVAKTEVSKDGFRLDIEGKLINKLEEG